MAAAFLRTPGGELSPAYLETGDAFIDVGANAGYFSVIASALVGEQGEVHAFEPNDGPFQLLKVSVKRNRLTNVSLNQSAAWSETSDLELVCMDDSAFSYVKDKPSEEKDLKKIKAVSLNAYAQSAIHRPIRLVKIDTEGSEYHVLQGMKELLMKESPALILELQNWSLGRYKQRIQDVVTYLINHGYEIFDLDLNNIRPDQVEDALAKTWIKNLIFEKKRMG